MKGNCKWIATTTTTPTTRAARETINWTDTMNQWSAKCSANVIKRAKTTKQETMYQRILNVNNYVCNNSKMLLLMVCEKYLYIGGFCFEIWETNWVNVAIFVCVSHE